MNIFHVKLFLSILESISYCQYLCRLVLIILMCWKEDLVIWLIPIYFTDDVCNKMYIKTSLYMHDSKIKLLLIYVLSNNWCEMCKYNISIDIIYTLYRHLVDAYFLCHEFQILFLTIIKPQSIDLELWHNKNHCHKKCPF